MKAILGALVGDAAGAYYEFYQDEITPEMATKAMKMPGGGYHRIGPGQITDDGELTLALWQAIRSSDPKQGLPTKYVIKAYSDWYNSFPFDIGRTCSLAFGLCTDLVKSLSMNDISKEDIHLPCRRINKFNSYSEANGALMRASAIATWIAKDDEIPAHIGALAAMEDATLSHPKNICQEINAIYVFTLINLLRGISPQEALKYTNEFIEMNDISDKVKHWYFTESLDIEPYNMRDLSGHIRWAFILAFYFLRHPEITYEEAIQKTIMKGGDTDTNAAIVGGLVACYHTIPEYMLQPVLQFDCTIPSDFTTQRIKRPSEYSVKAVLADSLWVVLENNK